ncbi:MAG: hypothetical protein UHK44_02390 [Bacteroidaceae bacterium]|nr:hypothetical protein [Bacteroidaceae bacterium]
MMIIASLARNYLLSDLGLCYEKSENALGGGKLYRHRGLNVDFWKIDDMHPKQ